jgi:hypothetical protein
MSVTTTARVTGADLTIVRTISMGMDTDTVMDMVTDMDTGDSIKGIM